MKMFEYADREMLAIEVANNLAGELKQSLLVNEFASFAVPGGTSPGPIFDALCAADLDWSRVHVMLTDERWVDEDHAQSNTALLRNRLLTNRAAAAKFIAFYRPEQTATEAAADLSEQLKSELPISVLLLGMGADMHTASLFPGAPELEAALAANAPALCAVQPPGHEISRLSLTGPALSGAMSTHIVIYGDEKREALNRASSLPALQAPVSTVLSTAHIHWAA
ncbi:6-phosphogluconolactonase [Sulfitobacter sp. SK012]|uniref:6-phosphogluconolactonase n=1 Tax=Sulfitobacter sp. SK012 TaxID=1389005 RepID=UPI000E0A1E67|nr:6-phosphogluconolactonase [Sulfitobacter sp. SK012]AXI46751.1 6-phosphogluconolactonase [Sulfitobacter sp. SK012]